MLPTFFFVTSFLHQISLVQGSQSHLSQRFSKSNHSVAQNVEIVNVTFKMFLTDKHSVEYNIHSLEDIDKLQKAIAAYQENLEVIIKQNLKHSITLYLRRNSLVIAKGFVRKHFTSAGKPIIEKSDSKDKQLASCLYTGKLLGNEDSLVSFNLCNGINGVVEIPEKSIQLESVIQGSIVIHRWIEASSTERGQQLNCGTKAVNKRIPSLHSIRHHRRLPRELKLPAGHNSSTKYIELYVVMDNSMYRRSGDLDKTTMRAINMVNYASALYRQLNMYLVLVGVEVWNDRNKISYQLANNSRDEYDPDKLLAEFNKYRLHYFGRETPNDSGQLFTNVDFEGGTLGKGSTGSICTQANSGGVTYDQNANNYIRAATTMAHELGHNLLMRHSNAQDTYMGKDCECEYPDDPDFKKCIMHSSSSRKYYRWLLPYEWTISKFLFLKVTKLS